MLQVELQLHQLQEAHSKPENDAQKAVTEAKLATNANEAAARAEKQPTKLACNSSDKIKLVDEKIRRGSYCKVLKVEYKDGIAAVKCILQTEICATRKENCTSHLKRDISVLTTIAMDLPFLAPWPNGLPKLLATFGMQGDAATSQGATGDSAFQELSILGAKGEKKTLSGLVLVMEPYADMPLDEYLREQKRNGKRMFMVSMQ